VQMIPVLIGITLIVFVLLRVSGDPVVLMLPEDAPREQIEALRRNLGLDRPIPEQYLLFLRDLVRGDFGRSIRYGNQDVLEIVLERLPATLELAAAAILVALLISVPAGVVAATRRRRLPDHAATTFSVLGEAMPNFWLGIMLILVFAVNLRLLPVSGRGSLAHLVLPAITLGTGLAAVLTRLLRSSLIEALNQDYVRTAHAKGARPSVVLVKHAMRNALLGYLTEQVFAWPGIGLLAVQAINSRDMAIVQAIVIVSSLVVMVANLVVDVLYAVIDPRIQYS
jgi:peptide/nickel transport system permease protein